MSSPAAPTRPPAPKRSWVTPVAGFTLVLTIVGGLAVREIYRQPANAVPPSVVGTQVTTTSPVPSPGSAAPSQLVLLTADAGSYDYQLSGETLKDLLNDYFDSINRGNYNEWASVVTANLQGEHPRSDWLNQYHTVEDSDVIVYRVDEAPQGGGLRVLLAFTSRQDPAYAPPDFQYGCIRWQTVYSLTQERGHWRIDTTTAGRTPLMQKC